MRAAGINVLKQMVHASTVTAMTGDETTTTEVGSCFTDLHSTIQTTVVQVFCEALALHKVSFGKLALLDDMSAKIIDVANDERYFIF